MPEPTLVELLRNPYFRQVLLDLEAEKCKRYARDMRPVMFSLKYGRKLHRLIKAQRNRALLKAYLICNDLLRRLFDM